MRSNSKSEWLQLAVTGLLGAGTLALAQAATAADADREQCASVVRAGQNDCATSTNACHSHVETDGNPEAWIYLPTGTYLVSDTWDSRTPDESGKLTWQCSMVVI